MPRPLGGWKACWTGWRAIRSWHEFHRVVADSLPAGSRRHVPGLLSSNGGRDFAVILSGLVELGYGVAWRVLDAQHFGVPQRRRRVFVVGCLGDWGSPVPVLFEPESLRGDPPPRREAREGVAGTLGGGATGERGWRNDLDSNGAYIPVDEGDVMAFSNTSGDTALGLSLPGAPPMTTRHGDPGHLVRGTSVRRLTPTECERLQGFPDGWTAGQSDSTRYRQLGNAVAVPVARWIGTRFPEPQREPQ